MEGRRRVGGGKQNCNQKRVVERLRQKKQQKISSENFAILLGMNLRRKYSFALWNWNRERNIVSQQRQKLSQLNDFYDGKLYHEI